MIQDIFDQNIQYIKGIGPKRSELLSQFGIHNLFDLLEYYPRRYIDRSNIKSIAEANVDDITTLIGEVISIHEQPGRKKRLIITISDGTGYLQGIWFNSVHFFKKYFVEGQLVSFSGKITFFGGMQIVHPDYDILGEEISAEKFVNTGIVIPVYPSSEKFKRLGLTSFRFRQIFKDLFDQNISFPEILPPPFANQVPMSFSNAIKEIHFPSNSSSLEEAIYTLKYIELFMVQFLVALRYKKLQSNRNGKAFQLKSDNIRKMLSDLSFELTGAQKKVLKEIASDLNDDIPMHRLLQGDVGSGKTIVAFVAILLAVENGFQSALMVPTEILAEQHYLNAIKFFEKLDVKTVLLKGGLSKKERDSIYGEIEKGKAQVVIGTHALLQEKVTFKNIGLAVIDEQHRFGVLQRKALIQKGQEPHILIMTATPIPRTLTMTVYGDLNVSVIDELPEGRKIVKTAIRKNQHIDKIFAFIEDEIKSGRQIYVVYPLIDESEKLDYQAATEGYEQFQQRFSEYQIRLIHGRLTVEEKDFVMNEFKQGRVQVLVSTTVIEVGVDVPNATVMMIMNADRFGLSQLHQLRGRVGRGKYQSYCILMRNEKITEEAAQRLKAMENTNDGFEIAEMDWQIRGAGEFFGIRQSGFDDLKIANLVNDRKILESAKQQAYRLVEKDPHLLLDENSHLKKRFLKKYGNKLEDINLH